MKMEDINGNLVTVNVNQSTRPIRPKSRSKLQAIIGQKLLEKFPYHTILEDFTIPGSRLSVDFFVPSKKLVVEVQGEAHFENSPFFHKGNDFVKQIQHDVKKAEWAENNGFKFLEIIKEEDFDF